MNLCVIGGDDIYKFIARLCNFKNKCKWTMQ